MKGGSTCLSTRSTFRKRGRRARRSLEVEEQIEEEALVLLPLRDAWAARPKTVQRSKNRGSLKRLGHCATESTWGCRYRQGRIPMAGRKGEENRLSEEAALAVMLTGFMQVTHLALVELIRCRGGIGPWFDEFQAKVIHELRNPLTEDVGMSDER